MTRDAFITKIEATRICNKERRGVCLTPREQLKVNNEIVKIHLPYIDLATTLDAPLTILTMYTIRSAGFRCTSKTSADHLSQETHTDADKNWNER